MEFESLGHVVNENSSRIVKLAILNDGNVTGVNGTQVWEKIVYASCGLFSILACLMAFFLIYRHLKHWTEPKPQTNIVRILIMVPIYSIDSWLSIYFRHYEIYFDIVRDCYEVYIDDNYYYFSLF
jgi:hypothetical protein